MSQAQQQIQWKQVTNLPKGLNLPQAMSIDILGIQLGDTYPEVKSKLEKLAAEYAPPTKASEPPAASASAPTSPDFQAQVLNMQRAMELRQLDQMSGANSAPPITERTTIIRYQVPSGVITAEFVGEITLRRELPNGNAKIDETVTVRLSAPSSGGQVYAVRRSLSYGNGDQTGIAQFLQALKDKMGGAQAQQIGSTGDVYRYQFDGGRLVAPNPPTPDGQCSVESNPDTRSTARSINASGLCDVSLVARFGFGVSRQHAKFVNFYLSDQERAKANKETDYAFMESYVRGLLSQSGAAPKL
ncbi:hypothetical protein [Bradyrhizobium sp.]|uniref:hypothetical protein n=1 Tax=Bradyrhizobium sp. TaxID=376 RepID=UPI0039E6C686